MLLFNIYYTQVISLVTCWALMYGDKRMRIVTSNIHVIQDFERIIFQAKINDTEDSNRTDIAYILRCKNPYQIASGFYNHCDARVSGAG